MDVRDMFRMPGAGLSSIAELQNFGEIKGIVDRCTNDFLIRPDWEQNIEVVDLMNSTNSNAVRAEVIILLRRKLSSSRPKTVSLTISLVEALVKNGSMSVHSAVANESFMKEMAKVARKYNGKIGSDNIEVAELALDVIQAWGEAFLSRQKEFPAFVKTYHDLRKEGLRFKAQYDATRVSIFTPGASDANSGEWEDSGILKEAAIAVSMERKVSNNRPTKSGRLNNASAELLESIMTSMGILSEILVASDSASSLQSNDIAGAVALQIKSLQDGLGAAIEYELSHDSEGTELLFKMNDDSQMLLAVYSGVMDGTCTLAQAMEIVVTLGSEGVIAAAPSTSKSVSAPSSSSAGGGMDLLDFIDSTVSESRSVQSTHALLGPTTNFYVTPPLSTVSSSTNYDPFGSDPFGPGDSSIDDLLGSTPTVKSTVIDQFSTMSDNFTSSQSQVQRPTHSTPADALDSLLLTPNPNPKPPVLSPYLGMSPATGTSKHLVDLNALIFSGNTNAHVGLSGNNGYNQSKVQGYLESQPQQSRSPYETYTSHATVPSTPHIQNSYQQMPSMSLPLQQNTYGIRSDNMMPPPLPSSPPPSLPQQQQRNPFDSF